MFLLIERYLTYLISCVTTIAMRFAQVHPPFPPWESADFSNLFSRFVRSLHLQSEILSFKLRSSRSHVFEKSAPCTFFLILQLSSGVSDKTEISSFPFIAERCAPARELSTLKPVHQHDLRMLVIKIHSIAAAYINDVNSILIISVRRSMNFTYSRIF